VLLYAFDTRGDAVFFGCLLCLIATGSHLDNWGKRAKQLLALAAVVSSAVMVWIVFEVGTYARSMPLIWITVSEIASLVIIAYFVVHPAGTGTKAMGISILVLVGNMSYTIYLIHWPVFTALSPTTTLWPSWLLDIVRLLIVGAIAVFSWYVIEKPLTRWRRRELAPVVAQPS
jgi:peptidoglycan/LPS O-acetylase OafA/YrhL